MSIGFYLSTQFLRVRQEYKGTQYSPEVLALAGRLKIKTRPVNKKILEKKTSGWSLIGLLGGRSDIKIRIAQGLIDQNQQDSLSRGVLEVGFKPEDVEITARVVQTDKEALGKLVDTVTLKGFVISCIHYGDFTYSYSHDHHFSSADRRVLSLASSIAEKSIVSSETSHLAARVRIGNEREVFGTVLDNINVALRLAMVGLFKQNQIHFGMFDWVDIDAKDILARVNATGGAKVTGFRWQDSTLLFSDPLIS
ncbi:MAG: hypothetical protein NT099_08050 [Candidatus Saganbacteria bacterium]|nr:hypothetical protein [Candidatus Saganbacteria bacterium]